MNGSFSLNLNCSSLFYSSSTCAGLKVVAAKVGYAYVKEIEAARAAVTKPLPKSATFLSIRPELEVEC